MLRRRLRDEQAGFGMVLVVLIGAMLTLLSVILIEQVRGESNRSVHAVYGGTSYQAAEAAIDDYVSKLVDDRLYYLHFVHPGELPRRATDGTDVGVGDTVEPWTLGQSWTYPYSKETVSDDEWLDLPNGYEYVLRVYPPDTSSQYVRIVAAGRKAGSTTDVRVIEIWVRPSSLADYYRVVDGNVSWGPGAITNGKIYANGNIDHDGIATGDIYSYGQITGSVVMQSPGPGEPVPRQYDLDTVPPVQAKIPNPIDFTSFLASFTDIERASQLPEGLNLANDTSYDAYRLTFNSGGTITVEKCNGIGASDVADVVPDCDDTPPVTEPVPANGAVYAYQDVIVQGEVEGRVTVASNDDIIVANNITYITGGEDVLGLVAKNYVYVAKYVPDTLTWSAGVIAQTRTWKARPWDTGGSPCPSGAPGQPALKSLMQFRGMAATADGGSFACMFLDRDYGYDPNFLWLPPPWFPVVEDAYTVLLFRELPSAT